MHTKALMADNCPNSVFFFSLSNKDRCFNPKELVPSGGTQVLTGIGWSDLGRVGISDVPKLYQISWGFSTTLKWLEGINLCWDVLRFSYFRLNPKRLGPRAT